MFLSHVLILKGLVVILDSLVVILECLLLLLNVLVNQQWVVPLVVFKGVDSIENICYR